MLKYNVSEVFAGATSKRRRIDVVVETMGLLWIVAKIPGLMWNVSVETR